MDKNDRWIVKNFGRLVDLYGGRCIAVVDRRVVAVGRRPDQVERRARAITGLDVPSVVMVPRKERRPIVTVPKVRLFGLS